MSIVITGKNIEVGDSLRTHIQNQVEIVSKRYFDEVIETHVTLTKETSHFVVDLAIHISKHVIVRTHGDNEDPYRAVDGAIEKIETRIRKYKSRLRDRKRQSKEDTLPAQYSVFNAAQEDQGEDVPVIIAEMASEIPTLTVSGAVMRLDLTDAPLVMFKNASHGQFNVVYRRQDGNIGWIDPSIQS